MAANFGYICILILILFDNLFSLICARNAIVIENQKQGTPSNEWDINGAGDHSIEGFAVPFSINIGQSVQLRINTSATKYRIDIYRVGYYQGNGARKLATFIQNKPSLQSDCIQLPQWRTVTCNNWSPTLIFHTANKSLISGVYFARLTRLDITNINHKHYNWRVDNSDFPAQDQFCEENCHMKPKPSKHSYGASGYGIARHKLKEPYASHIYFIIRNDASHSDLLMQTSDTTWQAYNRYGGASTYGSFNPLDAKQRAVKVTYNRPIVTRDYRSINMLFSAEYPAIRFLEKNGFDVSYITGLDLSTFMNENIMMQRLTNHKVFLSVGHDEYWSMKQRQLITNAIRKHGIHAMFWSGNEMYWKIRFEDDNIDEINTANPMMVIFKETRKRIVKIDNSSEIWTGTWRDEHDAFVEYEKGPYPENAVTGQLYTVDVWRSDPIHVPWYFARHKFWRFCSEVTSLNIGDAAYILRKPLIGHEFDEDIDNGYRPMGLQHLSETTIDNVQYLLDWGIMYDTGTAQHHLTLYRDNISNALVFGAGSIMFSWALDDHHDSATGIPSHLENYYDCRVVQDGYGSIKELQQAMFNLFADMKVNKPETMNENMFRYERYDGVVQVGMPTSWMYYYDPNKERQHVEGVVVENTNGLRCIRIEGGSTIEHGEGMIASLEIVVSNKYIDGEQWNGKDMRWYAAMIDYDRIASEYSNVNDIDVWYWYFEAWIDVHMKEKLFVKSRATNDNGNVQNIKDLLYTDIDLNKLKPCIVKQWIWRKRPVLISETQIRVQKKEL